jgi:Glycosyl transferases group 1
MTDTASHALDPQYSKLPSRVNFVCDHAERWQELISDAPKSLPNPDEIPERIVSSSDAWIVCTYLRLAAVKANVRVVDRVIPGEICVVDGREISIRNLSYNSFVICCRGDCPDPTIADWVVAQNSVQTCTRKSSSIPLWPQPGLIPRDITRGPMLENLAYKGHIRNLDDSFKTAAFRSALLALGIVFHLDVCDDQFSRTTGWNDFRSTDALLAARNLTLEDALLKPPSKLVNAWGAGVPALMGPEPAFRELRKSELDYIEIRGPDDMIEALRRLKAQPALYEAMVANGLRRYTQFTTEKIVESWLAMLAGPVAEEFRRWETASAPTRLFRYAVRSLQFKSAQRAYMQNINNGPRIFDVA